MKVTNIGTEYGHRKNAFCDKTVSKCYFASVFQTDFLFEKDGKMQRGERGDAIIMPPGTVIYHGPVPESETGFINDWVYFFPKAKYRDCRCALRLRLMMKHSDGILKILSANLR